MSIVLLPEVIQCSECAHIAEVWEHNGELLADGFPASYSDEAGVEFEIVHDNGGDPCYNTLFTLWRD